MSDNIQNRFHPAFGHKLSDGNIRILFAGEQLTLGTKRLFRSLSGCSESHSRPSPVQLDRHTFPSTVQIPDY